MNTLNAPHPEGTFSSGNQANRDVPPQDPWADAHSAPPDHSGNLAPLPHMTPGQEAAEFEGIVQDFKPTTVTPQIDTNGNTLALPTPEPTEAGYTPRHSVIEGGYQGGHRRLNEQTAFTPTPISDIERRNKANLQATLALRETLATTEPELLQDAKVLAPGEATQKITLPTSEEPPEQPIEQAPLTQERPTNYRSRHRLLGRLARFFSR